MNCVSQKKYQTIHSDKMAENNTATQIVKW